MNLLPKTSQQFGHTDYWNEFFKKRGQKAFEWYGEYAELCGYLHKYIKSKDNILMVGCGNSKLSMDMYDIGLKDITNIDISQVVIKQMLDLNKTQRPDMKYIHMDATAMTFPDDSFSVVLDKGTLDALMTDSRPEVIDMARKYCAEIMRVLKNGGRYVCISLLQDHILKFLIEFFPSNNFMFRVVQCIEAEQKTAESSPDGNVMPVFFIVATKFKMLSQEILEFSFGGDKMQRIKSTEELLEVITTAQKAAMVCNGLSQNSISGEGEVCLKLLENNLTDHRYTMYILDQTPSRGNGKYAAFIVPQGRETEWLFATPEGRKKLLETSRQDRLAIVTMDRDKKYSSLDDVKTELANVLLSIAPRGLKEKIPYLTLGQDTNAREIIHRGTTQLSGDFVVEDVEVDSKKIFRRLIFLNNKSVIQSEALVKTITNRQRTIKKIDFGHLACQHHLYMSIGINYSLRKSKKDGDILVIGLGGGGLCMFIHEVFRNSKTTAVDIDPIMLEIAEKFFSLKQDDRLKVEIGDGITYLKKALKSDKNFNAILFDVDSKDLTQGMSCPPAIFLQSNVLKQVQTLIGNEGVFILNLVCRGEKVRENVTTELRSIFKSVCNYKLKEDVNEIIYCTNHDVRSWSKALTAASKDLNQLVTQMKLSKEQMIDISSFIADLHI